MVLAPLPSQCASSSNFLMPKEILAKRPSLAELSKDIVQEIKEEKDSVVISFTEATTIPQKLLLRNALMDLFRKERMTNTIADVSSSTGSLTIRNIAFEKLQDMNIIPKSKNNFCTIA